MGLLSKGSENGALFFVPIRTDFAEAVTQLYEAPNELCGK